MVRNLNAFVGADIFRTAHPRNRRHRTDPAGGSASEGFVDIGKMAKTFDIGLMAFKVVQAGESCRPPFVEADNVDGMADGLHPLLEHENRHSSVNSPINIGIFLQPILRIFLRV